MGRIGVSGNGGIGKLFMRRQLCLTTTNVDTPSEFWMSRVKRGANGTYSYNKGCCFTGVWKWFGMGQYGTQIHTDSTGRLQGQFRASFVWFCVLAF